MSGFFFCVRATRITVTGCTLARNNTGVSIGTRDCYNHIDGCTVVNNQSAGVFVRPTPVPTEVHSILIEGCVISGNGKTSGGSDSGHDDAQVVITSDAHDIVLVGNVIERGIAMAASIGLLSTENVTAVALQGNNFGDDLVADTAELGAAELVHSTSALPPAFECGYAAPEAPRDGVWFRHLPLTARL